MNLLSWCMWFYQCIPHLCRYYMDYRRFQDNEIQTLKAKLRRPPARGNATGQSMRPFLTGLANVIVCDNVRREILCQGVSVVCAECSSCTGLCVCVCLQCQARIWMTRAPSPLAPLLSLGEEQELEAV